MTKKSEMYEKMAKEYLSSTKTVFQLCTEYEEKLGWFPSPKSVSDHIRKIRAKSTGEILVGYVAKFKNGHVESLRDEIELGEFLKRFDVVEEIEYVGVV